MPRELDERQQLAALARIARGGDRFDTSKLEADFLQFSFHTPRQALIVKPPKLYKLEGDERQHYAEALNVSEVPDAIDISGAAALDDALELICIVSPQQLQADHIGTLRSYLNPLLEKVYSEDKALLSSFAVHEALVGNVEAKRDDLPLPQVPLFPDRFSAGPYTLTVTLDTPAKSVSRFRDLTALLKEFEQRPNQILNSKKVGEATTLALELRNKLGSLSRLSPAAQEFSVATNSCVVRTPEYALFYLYAKEKNVVVSFGRSPFAEVGNLTVLEGDKHEETLAALVELGVYDPSIPVLRQRIKDLTQLYATAAQHQGIGNGAEFRRLLESLRAAEHYFAKTRSAEMRRSYVVGVSPELLEFMVCPAAEDPLVHELLPRLSWNSALRTYRYTGRFVRQFEEADAEGRKAMLEGVVANLLFNHQQNNDVNAWLYRKHHAFCESIGVQFRVVT